MKTLLQILLLEKQINYDANTELSKYDALLKDVRKGKQL